MLIETIVLGFFKIPNFSRYGLARNGQVINLKTLYLLKPIRHFRGYMRFVLVNDQNEQTSVSRHRLMGLVFIECPGNPDEMLINHKNLIPGDDRIDNLEWCTHAGNMEHAKKNFARRGKISVERRNQSSGKIEVFRDRVTCAKESGLTIYQLLWRLEHDPSRLYPEGYQYRLLGDQRSWGIVNNEEINFGRNKCIVVKDLLTNTEIKFESQREASKYLDVSEAAISTWLNSNEQPVVGDLKQLKYSDQEWRRFEDPYLEYEKFSKRRAVVSIDDVSGKVNIYHFANQCAFENKISPTLLNYRLLSNGLKVFPDGKRFMYYRDYLNSNWSATAS